MLIVWSMPMDFIWAAAPGRSFVPFISAMFISNRDLPASKLILPGIVREFPDAGSVIWNSRAAVNDWFSPNNLPVAPSKCGPSVERPWLLDCACDVTRPRLKQADARKEIYFFMVDCQFQKIKCGTSLRKSSKNYFFARQFFLCYKLGSEFRTQPWS